ncbi:D-alanine--D-alanine ligase family protein [Roseburia inulinivorans]|jgi:D-alanine-D-alanine ligase|uniref:ATP-grasp domain-containing protein n=1 Tax=Roseburia inulinivorans TaxID=360807 RepID=A0A396AJ43_9FIRM|nr:hypothetical protein [Roseburia inulinivorans]RHD05870.1 hypothetical protein DW813_02780 [Roseburia inulinivorans]RHF87318.1 hypothetical protein DW654_00665 [Roseburia inulinivorans]
MKIGITYDLKSDYGIEQTNITFEDFSTMSEIEGIQQELEQLGHSVYMIGSPEHFMLELQNGIYKQYDMIMNFAEGFASRNREALVPAACEMFHIPYTCSDSHAMNLTLDKHQTLLFAKYLGINVPQGFLYDSTIHKINELDPFLEKYRMAFPIVCKPNYEGTSMGITLVKNSIELQEAVNYLSSIYHEPIRCDEYIPGREIAVPILGSGENARVIGIVEYQKPDGSPMDFYTHKYKRHGFHKTIFADYGKEINSRIEETALLIHRSIPCYDLSRIDMRLNNGVPYLLEVTPLPDMTRKSTFERCAAKIGLTFGELLDNIISSALERYN